MREILDLIDAIVVGAVIAVVLTATVTSMRIPIAQRLAFAAVAGAWVGFAAAVAAFGGLENDPRIIGALVAFPLVTTAAVAALSPGARRTLMELPMPLLIALNAARVIGVLFLALAALGRLAGPFPFSAGLGDIVTGAFALRIARLAARAQPEDRSAILIWNVFGTLDLVAALALGVLSADGSPIQLIHAGVGSAAITTLPWSMIPTLLVPFYLIVHAVVFARLSAMRHVREERRAHAPLVGA
jgi:hypothetical protein